MLIEIEESCCKDTERGHIAQNRGDYPKESDRRLGDRSRRGGTAIGRLGTHRRRTPGSGDLGRCAIDPGRCGAYHQQSISGRFDSCQDGGRPHGESHFAKLSPWRRMRIVR